MRADQFHFAIRKFEPFETFLKLRWEEYCQLSGCKLQLIAEAMDLPELHASLLTENGLKNGKWDLALVSSDWMTEACDSGAVRSIESLISDKDFLNAWPSSLLRSQKHQDKHYGVPFHDGPECLIYRKDLFEDPAHCTAFLARYGYILEPPKNWQTFHDVARYFQQADTNLYGTALAAFPDGHNAVYDFCIQAWTRSGEFMQPGGHVNFQCTAIEDGLSFYRELSHDTSAIHRDSREMDSVKLGMAFTRGELAMMINWFGFATYAALLKDSPVAGKIGIAPIPHQPNAQPVAPNSYWVYAVGSGSTHAAVAMDFIQFATQPLHDVALTLGGGIGCRKSTWSDDNVNEQIPFFNDLESLHDHARELPDLAEWPAIAKIIDEIMIKVASTTEPIAEILLAAQSAVEELQTNTQPKTV